ncbi:LamG-like jellyroll fold domain-containing protein [Mycetocola zhadangensis]|uniref:CBM96 family carbohydrate-binding protein n=1 Tax=Mycetocola zhadangensis TaxID=1164595 RepID=UPI003A4DA196
MRSRVLGSVVAVLTLALCAVVVTPSFEKASALSPGVHFSADNLPTWQTNGVVYGLAQSNGKVVAGGTFSQIRPPNGTSGTAQTRNGLAIFNAETGLPDTCQFSIALSGGTPTVRSVVASPDGNTVYVGGNFSNIGGVTVGRVAALDVQTCTVRAFRASAVSSFVYGMAVSGNTLYIAGQFQSVAGQERLRFAALNATTGALLPWVANADNIGRAVAVSPDGSKVAVGGDFFTVNGQNSHSIGVVDGATGTNVRNYPVGFISQTSVTKTLYSSGNAFYGGNEGTGGGVFDGRFAIDWNTLDEKWRDTCLGATQAVLEYQGTLYSANHAHDCASNRAFQDGKRSYFVAQNAESAELLGWNPLGNDGTGEGIGPRALAIATGNTTGQPYLWAAGEFTLINGSGQQGLTRFSAADTGNPPIPAVTAQATSSGSIQVRFRTVVDADDSVLTYRVYRNGSATPIWQGTANSVWWKRPQVTFVDTTAVAGTTYSYRVTASDGTNTSNLSTSVSARALAPVSDYPAAVRADGAQIYWQYDGTSGTWVQDKSAAATKTDGLSGIAENGIGHAADGAFANDATGSATFDAVDDYVWEDNYAPGPSTYTIETWIKTSTTTGGKIIGYGNGRPRTDTGATVASGSYDRHIYMDNTGRLTFGVYTGSTVTVRSAASYNDGTWHHIVASQGSTGMALYVDGVRVGQNGTTNAQSYYGVWRVGGDNLSGWPNRPASDFFNGQIDETAIYGSVLSRQQVLNHYSMGGGSVITNPAPADSYGKAVYGSDPDLYWRLADGDASSAADSSLFGASPGSYGTDVTRGTTGVVGENAAVTTKGSQNSTIATTVSGGSSTTFATELWFNTSTTSGGKLIGFENTQTGNGSDYDKQIYMINSGALIFGVYTGGVAYLQTPATYNDGTWHHVVGLQDSTGMKLYVDGTLVGSNSTATNQAFTGFWRIGGGNLNSWPSQPSNSYFTGTLDEVAVYSHSLTSDDVATHYATGINDSTAPSTPTNLEGSFSAGAVELDWDASTDNIGVVAYRIYRGTSADFVADGATLVDEVSGTSWAEADASVGIAFYKVTAVDASGNVSAPTEAVSIAVPDAAAPSVPGGVTSTADGTSAAISWTESTDNVGVVGYAVYRGSTSDFEADAISKIADVAGAVFSDTDLAPGTYYYKITAVDAAGNISDSSLSAGPVSIAAPDTTAPSAPQDVTATVEESTVNLVWSASVDDVGVTGYSVYRGTAPDFAVDGASKIADTQSTMYTDTGLAAGTYYYKVTAVDAAGNASIASGASAPVAIVFVDSSAPTTPSSLAATAVGSAVGLTWNASSDNVGVTSYAVYRGTSSAFVANDASKIGDSEGTSYSDEGLANGTWYYKVSAVDASGNFSSSTTAVSALVGPPAGEPVVVQVAPTEDSMVFQVNSGTNYGNDAQLSARGTATNSAIESFLKFPLPAAPAGTTLTGASLAVRTSTDPAAGSTDTHTFSLSESSWGESTITWSNRPTGAGTTLGTLSGATATNTPYASVLSPSALANLAGQTVSLRLTSVGGDNLRLWSSEAPNATYRPVLTLSFSPGAGPTPDTTAPSAPTSVSAAVSGSTVTVAWAASTDNVGVTGYSVYRGTSDTFVADGASKIADVSGTSHVNSGVPVGTWYYKVLARDAAGNVSPLSAGASATVAAPPLAPITMQVAPTDDAMVLQATPTTNYGNDQQLSARGTGASMIESFLRFTLPQAPAGYTLNAASLAVRTSTDPAAGSVDTLTFAVVTGDWAESAITWANRPTVSTATLGTLSGATATNAPYTSALAVAAVQPLLGQTVSLRLVGNGSDNVRLWSTEASATAYRPVLTLSYTPIG